MAFGADSSAIQINGDFILTKLLKLFDNQLGVELSQSFEQIRGKLFQYRW